MLTKVEDIRQALANLANIPPRTSADAMASAKQFIERYGKLRRPKVTQPTEDDYALDVIRVADQFRHAWKATADQDEGEMQYVSLYLDSIFEPSPWRMDQGSAIRADFANGKWTPVARNLLDKLAIELMNVPHGWLHRCENPDCQKYIVKQFSADKYCSIRCSDIMRRKKVTEWRRKDRAAKKRRGK